MKESVAIAGLIIGAFLIVFPPLADYLHELNVVRLLSAENTRQVTLNFRISETYSFGCWIAGIGLIVVSILSSLKKVKPESE